MAEMTAVVPTPDPAKTPPPTAPPTHQTLIAHKSLTQPFSMDATRDMKKGYERIALQTKDHFVVGMDPQTLLEDLLPWNDDALNYISGHLSLVHTYGYSPPYAEAAQGRATKMPIKTELCAKRPLRNPMTPGGTTLFSFSSIDLGNEENWEQSIVFIRQIIFSAKAAPCSAVETCNVDDGEVRPS
ncbi:hypothetical protein BYT27DRAFT_7333610 [Phlegmacium glaucopus]|nr:hypothetical protein BYT27DRAFT_7333610 [Phlegmacium glaucopus]